MFFPWFTFETSSGQVSKGMIWYTGVTEVCFFLGPSPSPEVSASIDAFLFFPSVFGKILINCALLKIPTLRLSPWNRLLSPFPCLN